MHVRSKLMLYVLGFGAALGCVDSPSSAIGDDESELFVATGVTTGAGWVGGGFVPTPPTDDPDPAPYLVPPTLLDIINLGAAGLTLRWEPLDTRGEAYELIRFRPGMAGSSSRVKTIDDSDLVGKQSIRNDGLQPDTLYCYFMNVIAFGFSPESSEYICAYTKGEDPYAIYRAQLEITVADVSDAGTDNMVLFRTNSVQDLPGTIPARATSSRPSSMQIRINTPAEDFDRNHQYVFDIKHRSRLEDIKSLQIRKLGTDGLCISRVALVVNRRDGVGSRPANPGVTVFEKEFGNSSCHWIDRDDGHQPSLVFTHAELRAHRLWPTRPTAWPCGQDIALCSIRMFPMNMSDLHSRLLAVLGDMVASRSDLKWRTSNPLQLTAIDERTLGIRILFEGVVDNYWNPDIEINAKAYIKMREHDGLVTSTLEVDEIDASVNFGLPEKLATAVACTYYTAQPLACFALHELIEAIIEGHVEEGIDPISESFSYRGIDGLCYRLELSAHSVDAVATPCDDLDADDMPNDWEQEHGLDPSDPRDRSLDPDGDGISNAGEYAQGSDPNCRWSKGHLNYCRDCGPCEAGEGDCDPVAGQCVAGLVCATDVGGKYGLPANYDVCECPWAKGDASYCRDCGPCAAGEGDCDPGQCAEGTVCVNDVGAEYGLPRHYDVCECDVDPMDRDYCTKCGQCKHGVGDCDPGKPEDCAPGLECVDDIGAAYGYADDWDVCIDPHYMPPLVAKP